MDIKKYCINKEKLLYLIIAIILISQEFSCSIPNLGKSKNESEKILKYLKQNDWEAIWDKTSLEFKKKIDYDKYKRLEKWVKKELGRIKKYEEKYFYSGSRFGIEGGYFVKFNYNVEFEKGIGEIEIILIEEKKEFRVLSLEFVKKPDI